MWNQKQLALQAELNFIKGQIHPHFLFNTLNNLYALTLKQSSQSPSVVLELSKILRYMLYESNIGFVKLSRDIEILNSYITLEKIRYDKRLKFNMSILGERQNYYIAPLLMFPLVENAFKHGAGETINSPWIDIDVIISMGKLRFKVTNSKPFHKCEDAEIHFEKIGLTNVKKRLDIQYKNSYEFNTCDEEEMFTAILEIDLVKSAGNDYENMPEL